MIPFNKPTITGNELEYISQVIASKKLSGDGVFTNKCTQFFETKYGFKKALLTTSCTDALEMCAILCDIQVGDEIISLPSIPNFIINGVHTFYIICNDENERSDLINYLNEYKIKAVFNKNKKMQTQAY